MHFPVLSLEKKTTVVGMPIFQKSTFSIADVALFSILKPPLCSSPVSRPLLDPNPAGGKALVILLVLALLQVAHCMHTHTYVHLCGWRLLVEEPPKP